MIASTTDYHGLGSTGETILVRRTAKGDAMFINPARFAAGAALELVVPKQDQDAPYTQSLMKRQKLSEDAVDYTGHKVIAVTRYLEEVDWGRWCRCAGSKRSRRSTGCAGCC